MSRKVGLVVLILFSSIVLGVVGAYFGWITPLVRRDFNKICASYEDLLANRGNPQFDPALAAIKLDRSILSRPARQAMWAIGNAADQDKAALYDKVAAELGLTGWSCPAIATVYAPAQ